MENQIARAYGPPENAGALPEPLPEETGQIRRSRVGQIGSVPQASPAIIPNAAGRLRRHADSPADLQIVEAVPQIDSADDPPPPEPVGSPSAIQQAALRQALRAASQANTQLESLQLEMVKVRDRLQRSEQARLSQALAFRGQSDAAEAKVRNLTNELSAAVLRNETIESRAKAGKITGWLALGATSVIAVCTFLFYHPGPSRAGESPRPDAPDAVALVHQTDREAKSLTRRESPLTPETGRPAGGHQSAEEQALNRLDRSIGGISREESRAVLNEANGKLQASGAPPCTTRQGDGNASLVVTGGQPGARGAGPLAAALVRCADAVDQVVR